MLSSLIAQLNQVEKGSVNVKKRDSKREVAARQAVGPGEVKDAGVRDPGREDKTAARVTLEIGPVAGMQPGLMARTG